MKKPVVLLVLDGMGYSETEEGNAIKQARTPQMSKLMKEEPMTYLKAHGKAVGLPTDDDMGNSEVGHNAIGCGQIYAQGAQLVNESIEDESLWDSDMWQEITANNNKHDSTLHFLGLLSDGNVHSHINHLKAMIGQAKKENVTKVRVHVLLDGRDVNATSALEYVDELETYLATLNDDTFDGKIASGGGRMNITMDRYNADWSMVKRGWDTHVLGKGRQFASTKEAIEVMRGEEKGIIDQDLPPFVIGQGHEAVGTIEDKDSVIFFNFRGDRAIEMSRAFEEEDFDEFDRERFPDITFAGLLQYDGDAHIPKNYLVTPPRIKNTLSETLVEANINQFATSETQKYGHMTYFWNGNRASKFSETLETFKEIPSDTVSFSERPWMKAAQITDTVIDAMAKKEYDFIRANFPNGDMVGHTGHFEATILAVEAVDLALERIIKATERHGYILIVTADHGNADDMYSIKDGKKTIKTSHTLNKVPFIIYDHIRKHFLKEGDFGLSNIAATVTDLLGVKPHPSWEESMLYEQRK